MDGGGTGAASSTKGGTMERIRVASRLRAGLLAAAAFGAVVAVVGSVRLVEARTDDPQTTVEHNAADARSIRGMIAKYAKSIDGADTTLAGEIWSKSPGVSFIHPRGHERGWEQVKRNVYEKLMGETFSRRKLTPRDVVVHVYGDAAWAEFSWDFVAKVRNDGSTLKTLGRETQIYRKTEGRWTLVHVHYFGMPVTGRLQGF
jgi:ketosteroid isomerase-like protein